MKRRLPFTLLLLLPAIAFADDAALSPSDLAARLAADNPNTRTAALKIIETRLTDQPAPTLGYVRSVWLPALLNHHHDADALLLLQAAILAVPQDTASLAWFQRQRISALQRLGRHDDALAAAKTLFNECPFAATDDHLLLLAECLNTARGVESGDVERLADEECAGLAGTEAAPIPSPTLRSISVRPADVSFLDPGLRRLYLPLNALPVAPTDLLGLGNLLLLADRPADALSAFEKLQSLGGTPGQLRTANEAVARALRAIDGTLGRANAFAARLTKT